MEQRKKKEEIVVVEKVSTVRSTELGYSINKTLMKLNSPSEAGLRISGEDKAGISLNT